MRGAIDQRGRKRLTAKLADVHAFIFAHLRRIQAGRLPTHRMHAGRGNFNVLAIAKHSTEKAFRNGAAANVTRTNKENAFHNERARQRTRNQPRIEQGQVNARRKKNDEAA
jgi:hypothetical protein